MLARIRAVVLEADVHEVGSTAIPGLPGKQDLDVLVRSERDAFDATRDRLDAHFPRNPDQLSTHEYQGYRVPSALDVAIQLTVRGGPYDDFLRFLAALHADPALVARYAALKHAFHDQPMSDYRAAKSAFIEGVLARDKAAQPG